MVVVVVVHMEGWFGAARGAPLEGVLFIGACVFEGGITEGALAVVAQRRPSAGAD